MIHLPSNANATIGGTNLLRASKGGKGRGTERRRSREPSEERRDRRETSEDARSAGEDERAARKLLKKLIADRLPRNAGPGTSSRRTAAKEGSEQGDQRRHPEGVRRKSSMESLQTPSTSSTTRTKTSSTRPRGIEDTDEDASMGDPEEISDLDEYLKRRQEEGRAASRGEAGRRPHDSRARNLP